MTPASKVEDSTGEVGAFPLGSGAPESLLIDQRTRIDPRTGEARAEASALRAPRRTAAYTRRSRCSPSSAVSSPRRFAAPVLYVAWRAVTLGGDRGDVLAESLAPAWRTVQLAVLVTAGATLIGVAMAWLVTRTDLPLAPLWRVLAPLPLVFPSFIGAAAFIAGLGPDGVLRNLLELVGYHRRRASADSAPRCSCSRCSPTRSSTFRSPPGWRRCRHSWRRAAACSVTARCKRSAGSCSPSSVAPSPAARSWSRCTASASSAPCSCSVSTRSPGSSTPPASSTGPLRSRRRRSSW